jgi:hypothetical protein
MCVYFLLSTKNITSSFLIYIRNREWTKRKEKGFKYNLQEEENEKYS